MRDNFALFVMLGSSFFTFLTIVLIKNTSGPEVYSFFALLQLYIGYLFTAGYLSSDSVLIRYTIIDDRVIKFQVSVLKQLLTSWLFAAMILPLVGFFVLSNDYINYLILLSLFFVVTALYAVSIIERLSSRITSSQVALNLWKIIVFLGFVVVWYFEIQLDELLVQLVVLSGLFLSLIISTAKYGGSVKKETSVIESNIDDSNIYRLQYAYLVSIVFFAILGSFDRVLLQFSMDVSLYSEYLYFVTLMVFPIGIIANYVGYKELIDIKKGKDIDLNRSVSYAVMVSVSLYLVYSAFIYSFRDILNVEFDFFIWLAVFLIVLFKMPYSYLSAIIGAKGNSKDLIPVNHLCLILIICACVIVYYSGDVYVAIYSVTFVWFVRAYLFYLKSKLYV